ncbi:MAG TPA: glycosyltransferase family 87 protein [Candidatus Limnocylindrales bacterium]|nr:glycosyltransferase family 87 protein [Candidatus Limnocylindrales bacterium]
MATLAGSATALRVRRRPALWLAAAAVASGEGALYSIGRWIYSFVVFPIHEDVRINYVAAQAGLRFGWSKIYDFATLRELSLVFPAGERSIDATATYISPPLIAWLFVPLTLVPEPAAFVVWTLASLAALLWTWHAAAPYSGLAKFTLLLIAVALWPVMQTLYYGQPGVLLIAAVALSWWLLRREQTVAAGVALALATALKPQVALLVPVALLVSGRWKPFAAWACASAVLAGVSAASLGVDGLASYWQALKLVQQDTGHAYFTIAQLFGLGPLTYTLLALQGIACLVVARLRRQQLEVVFAVGLLGSVMVAFHLHQWDYTNLVLAAWLVLRGSPPLWHRLWLLVGIATLQLTSLGLALPQLGWNLVWLAILLAGSRSNEPRDERQAVAASAAT